MRSSSDSLAASRDENIRCCAFRGRGTFFPAAAFTVQHGLRRHLASTNQVPPCIVTHFRQHCLLLLSSAPARCSRSHPATPIIIAASSPRSNISIIPIRSGLMMKQLSETYEGHGPSASLYVRSRVCYSTLVIPLRLHF